MLNKKHIAILIFCFATVSAAPITAHGQAESRTVARSSVDNVHKDSQVGVGLQVGHMTGLALQYWNSETTTLNLAVTGIGNNFGVGLAYDWMFRDAFRGGETARAFVPFFGIGALGVFGTKSDALRRDTENTAFAVQVPLGIEFLPQSQRFGVFAKLSPSMELSPTGYFFLTADAGAHFYF